MLSKMRRLSSGLKRLLVLICLYPLESVAEENGTGAYPTGGIASHIDSMLPSPGWIVRGNSYNFIGENTITCMDLACTNRANIEGSLNAFSVTLGWRPEIDLGNNLSYMMSIVVPYLKVNASANIIANVDGSSFTVSDSNEGLGDLELIPLNFSYKLSDINDLNFKAIVRAPTGEFKKDQLANLGKNFWSFEPTISFLHHDHESSLYAAIYAGINFNSTNQDTKFHSGSQAHVEFTIEKKTPMGSGQAGFGLTGYKYHQIADDSGEGVLFEGNRARVSGIGPVVSYQGVWGNQPIVLELKWIHDFDVEHRFGGDTAILKAGMLF